MAPPTLILALDQPDRGRALGICEKLSGTVDFFKVGSELFTCAGPSLVEELRRSGARVFLDLKFHDIPTTVGRAVAAAARLGVTLLDVHASGGEAMMKAAAEAARSAASPAGRPLVFGVTVLTHLGDEDLSRLGVRRGSLDQAVWLARLARESGLDGVVASAGETARIREATGDSLAVLVPGVRPVWAAERHDQRRAGTPAEAARAGARYVVVGRPVSEASDPCGAALRILEELASA